MTTRQQIAAAVSRVTGVDWCDITLPGRWSPVRQARDVAVAVIRLTTKLSYPEIAQWLGYRSHTSAIAAEKRADMKTVNAVLATLGARPTVIHLPQYQPRSWVDGVMDRIRERVGLKPLMAERTGT